MGKELKHTMSTVSTEANEIVIPDIDEILEDIMSIINTEETEIMSVDVEYNINYNCEMDDWYECAMWYDLPELPDDNMIWGDTQDLILKHIIMVCGENNEK